VAHQIASQCDTLTLKSDALFDALSKGFISTERSLSPEGDPAGPASPASEVKSDVRTPDSSLQAQERDVRIYHASGAIDVGVLAACLEDWAIVE